MTARAFVWTTRRISNPQPLPDVWPIDIVLRAAFVAVVGNLLPISLSIFARNPDSKAHGANMGPIWGRQNPGGPHAGPMNFAIWEPLEPVKL